MTETKAMKSLKVFKGAENRTPLMRIKTIGMQLESIKSKYNMAMNMEKLTSK